MTYETVELDSLEQMHQFVLDYQGEILSTISTLKAMYPDAREALTVVEDIASKLPYNTDTTFTVNMEQTL